MEVRAPRGDELNAVARLWWASLQSTGLAQPYDDDAVMLRSRIDRELAAGWRLFVAVVDGGIAGMLALKPGVLDQLFVAPERQGQGVGTQLFAHACAELSDGFTLRTQAENHLARRFYVSRGMQLERIGPHPGGLPRPCAWYRWP